MAKAIDVSIILPSFNEERVIHDSLQKVATFVKSHKNELGVCEVIVVAVGGDRTAEIARGFEGKFDHLQVITRDSRVGKGRDVRLGVQAARGEVVLFMDVDLSTPLHHMLTMVKKLRGDADVVIGARKLASIHKSLLRSLLSVASNLLIRAVLFPKFRDTQCGFKGFRAQAARVLFATQSVRGWGFDLEVLQHAKEQRYRVEQLTIGDWHEAREEDFRGERLGGAALTTLKDLSVVRFGAWGRSLARHWKFWLVVAMSVSFGLSMWIGLKQSVWFDEAYSITLAQQSYERLIALTAVDAHPPFYYLVLKVWSGIWGVNDVALRSLSAICGALAAGAGLLLVKRLFGIRAMLVALPFIAAAPFLIRYGFEIRMYAMAALICLVATHVMLSALRARAQKSRIAYWIAYACLVALGMFTLYYTALVWIAHLAWLVWQSRRNHRRAAIIRQPWIAAFALSAVLLSPWLPVFYDQLTHSALSGVGERVTFVQLAGIVSMMFSFQAHWQLDAWQALAVLAAIMSIIYVVVTAFRAADEQKRQGFMLLIFYTLIPIGFLMLASMPPLRPMFLERYASHFIIGGYMLVGAGLALAYKVRKVKVTLIGIFLLALLTQGMVTLHQAGNFTFERVMRPHARDMAGLIGECKPGDLVIAGDPLLYFEMQYYASQCDTWFFNGTRPIGTRGGYAVLHNSPRQYFEGSPVNAATVYLVHTRDDGQPPFPLPTPYTQTNYQRIEKFHLATFTLTPSRGDDPADER